MFLILRNVADYVIHFTKFQGTQSYFSGHFPMRIIGKLLNLISSLNSFGYTRTGFNRAHCYSDLNHWEHLWDFRYKLYMHENLMLWIYWHHDSKGQQFHYHYNDKRKLWKWTVTGDRIRLCNVASLCYRPGICFSNLGPPSVSILLHCCCRLYGWRNWEVNQVHPN